MGLCIVSFATVLLLHYGTASAYVTGMPGWTNSLQVSNENVVSKFLCGIEFEVCYGQKLSTDVFALNNKIYKTEVYELKPTNTLNDIVNEQKYLKEALVVLANKVAEQGVITNEELLSVKRKQAQQFADFSMRIRKASEHRKHLDEPTSTDSNADLPASCAEAFAKDEFAESGIYTIYLPNFDSTPFEVYCLADPHGGAAWTVVQRRTDGAEDFYRDWDDYVAGFGDKEEEFFIGLDKLYALTNDQPNELWIQMEDFDGEERYAKYADFAIDNDIENYALNKLNGFTGNAGDSMIVQKGQQFTTRDHDNDSDPTKNCAIAYLGAWWYNRCHDSNLNGQYMPGGYYSVEEAQGIDWYTWHGHNYSLKYAHMAIRPKASSN
ncbi:ficolin-2-like [Anastrepha ludens]|uniref:ficolin-2-like n=1 Tax=Anastrepha ludens TaxID=28586 RepID=UPI0023B14A49|nr:ficolin-2-like [Anastrepha ludens]